MATVVPFAKCLTTRPLLDRQGPKMQFRSTKFVWRNGCYIDLMYEKTRNYADLQSHRQGRTGGQPAARERRARIRANLSSLGNNPSRMVDYGSDWAGRWEQLV